MQMIPSGAYPPLLKQGKVSIDFFIGRAGKVDGVKVHESSGNAQLDHAAWESIKGSDPFPPLAMEFSSEKIGLRFHFLYNLRPGDDFSVFLPAADVSVPPGSTLQFSVSNAGVAAGAVMWSVSGAGCEKSACGTISSAGLYTAPAKIPNPPTVIVEGTLQRDAGVQNSCEVTIVEAAPSN
jgi:TonB family protein